MFDFTTVLTDLDGQPIQETRAGPDGKPVAANLTLGRAAANALVGEFPTDKPADGAEKLRRFNLANKVRAAKASDLAVEDISLLKERISKAYGGALIYGRVCEILDPVGLDDTGAKAPRKKA